MTHHPYEVDLRGIAEGKLNCDMSRVGLDEPLIETAGVDSLAGLELMAEVEAHFDVCFRDDHIARPLTLANILTALDEVTPKKRRMS